MIDTEQAQLFNKRDASVWFIVDLIKQFLSKISALLLLQNVCLIYGDREVLSYLLSEP